MPVTRPSTRIQRRAQMSTPWQRGQQSTREASTSDSQSSISDSTITKIAAAVAQAMVELQSNQPSTAVPENREVNNTTTCSESDAQVQGPVASALEHLAGEHNLNLEVVRPRPVCMDFNSVAVPLDAQVSPKIKAKIWANEYIELGSLLNPRVGDSRYQLSVTQNDESTPTLSLEPTSKIKPITTVEMCTTAFQIFVAIYTSKFPQDAPSLMKYSEVVQDLAARGANCLFYDTQFRYLQQTKLQDMPWETTHFELRIRAQSFSRSTPKRPGFAQH